GNSAFALRIMSQESNSSAGFSSRSRRPRRARRRPPRPATGKVAEESGAVAPPPSETTGETVATTPEAHDRATPLAEAPAVEAAMPPPGATVPEPMPTERQPPPLEPERRHERAQDRP